MKRNDIENIFNKILILFLIIILCSFYGYYEQSGPKTYEGILINNQLENISQIAADKQNLIPFSRGFYLKEEYIQFLNFGFISKNNINKNEIINLLICISEELYVQTKKNKILTPFLKDFSKNNIKIVIVNPNYLESEKKSYLERGQLNWGEEFIFVVFDPIQSKFNELKQPFKEVLKEKI